MSTKRLNDASSQAEITLQLQVSSLLSPHVSPWLPLSPVKTDTVVTRLEFSDVVNHVVLFYSVGWTKAGIFIIILLDNYFLTKLLPIVAYIFVIILYTKPK